MIRLVAMISLLALWLSGCGQAPRTSEASASVIGPASMVHTELAVSEVIPESYEAAGTVQARTTGTVSARLMGYVSEVRVQTGDRVQAGQVLAILDSRDLEIAVRRAEAQGDELRAAIPEAESAAAAAKANQDLAEATFNRMQELYQKKSISNQEFDEASARLKAARAAYQMAQAKRAQIDSRMRQAEQELRSAEVTRGYATISAPFAGQITAKAAEPGNLALPGATLFTIERADAFRLEAAVDESLLKSARVGQSVAVRVDGLNRTAAGRVGEIVPNVDAASRAGMVKIDLPPIEGLHSGMFGKASFGLGSRSAITVPANAVTERGQLESVFIAENGAAHTRLVTLGRRVKERVEVLSGVSPGESVITPVPQDLRDGARIEARP